MKTFFIIGLVSIVFFKSTNAQVQDTGQTFKRIAFGIGGFTGIGNLLGQPDRAYTSQGSNYGICLQTQYWFNSRVSVWVDFRFMESNHIINFRNQMYPDFFTMHASTMQIPLLFSYSFHNKKNVNLFTAGIGAAYNWNNYNTFYEESVTTRPSTVQVRQVSVHSSDNDYSIMFSLSKNMLLNKSGGVHLRMFNECLLNINTPPFRNRVNDPFVVYIIGLNQDKDKFTPLYIRIGFYLSFGLKRLS